MNYLSSMLMNGPRIVSESKPKRSWLYSPEMIEKQKATRIRNTMARYREALITFPERKATTTQLSVALEKTPRAMAHTLKRYSQIKGTPLIFAGTLPTSGNGRDQHVWQWIGE